MAKAKIKLPKFKSEGREREFWAKFDLSKYFNQEDFEPVLFPNLKPTSRPISLRLPTYLLMRLKQEANEINVPYQSLIKKYIARGC